MRWWLLISAALLGGCDEPASERATLNAEAATSDITPTLQARVNGGAIITTCTTTESETLGPPRPSECGPDRGVIIRAQSLDLRVELHDRGCAPTLVAIEVKQLPVDGIEATYRVFLDVLSSEITAARGVLAGGLGLDADPHDSERTPMGPETVFEPPAHARRLNSRQFGVCLDRGRRQVQLGALETLRETCLETSATSLCTTSGTTSVGPLGSAGLLARIRLRAPLAARYHFATWGNSGGDREVQGQIINSVNACAAEPRFAIVSGDLTDTGRVSSMEAMATELDSILRVPWFGTLGDRDILGDVARKYLSVMGASSFAMDVGRARLIVLDSASAGLSSRDHNQLSAWLGPDPLWWAGDPVPPSRLVITHMPPFDPVGLRGEAFRSRGEAARVVAALQRGAVDRVITSQWAPFAIRHTAQVEIIDGGGGATPADGAAPYWLLVGVDPDCPVDAVHRACPGATTARCPCVSVTQVPIGGEDATICARTAEPDEND